MRGRRAHGAGSIYRKNGTGKFIAQLDLGRDAGGRRHRVTRSAHTMKEAQRLLRELEAKHRSTASGSRTEQAQEPELLAAYLRRWLQHHATNVSARTLELYRHQAEHHIIPLIGHIQLDELKPRDVQRMMDHIVAKGRVSTANKCRQMLFSALKRAVRWEILERNPVEAVDPVREHNDPLQLWTPDQVREFVNATRTHRHFAAYYVLITTGLRRGELLGLRWEDIEEHGLWVRQTVKIIGNKPTLGRTKTRASQRYIALPPDTVEILKAHRERQLADQALVGDSWAHPELVFPSETGSIMDPKNFYRTWKLATARAGLPPARIHDMRHLHVSLLIQAGEDAKLVSERAGHTSASFTFDRYAHVFAKRRQNAARSLDDLLTDTKP